MWLNSCFLSLLMVLLGVSSRLYIKLCRLTSIRSFFFFLKSTNIRSFNFNRNSICLSSKWIFQWKRYLAKWHAGPREQFFMTSCEFSNRCRHKAKQSSLWWLSRGIPLWVNCRLLIQTQPASQGKVKNKLLDIR